MKRTRRALDDGNRRVVPYPLPVFGHKSETYGRRFMLRLDDASRGKLDEFTEFFHASRAEVIRQLIIQATPETFPESWHLAAEERRQRQAGQADTSETRRS